MDLPRALQVGMLLTPGYLPREITACAFSSGQKGWRSLQGGGKICYGFKEPARALLQSLCSPNSLSLYHSEMF